MIGHLGLEIMSYPGTSTIICNITSKCKVCSAVKSVDVTCQFNQNSKYKKREGKERERRNCLQGFIRFHANPANS